MYDVSELDSPCSQVDINGIVTQLSPVKKSRTNDRVRYFDGKLSDGKKTLRVVSFEPGLRAQMDKSLTEKSPVTIVNCQEQKKTQYISANGPDTLEILASKKSKVQSSPHKNFDLPENLEALDPDCQPSVGIKLSEIDDIAVGQHVCITGKVTKLDTPVPIQNRFGKVIRKQESVIADVTGQVRVVLWENEIGK